MKNLGTSVVIPREYIGLSNFHEEKLLSLLFCKNVLILLNAWLVGWLNGKTEDENKTDQDHRIDNVVVIFYIIQDWCHSRPANYKLTLVFCVIMRAVEEEMTQFDIMPIVAECCAR